MLSRRRGSEQRGTCINRGDGGTQVVTEIRSSIEILVWRVIVIRLLLRPTESQMGQITGNTFVVEQEDGQ